jgi:hypothetical protein
MCFTETGSIGVKIPVTIQNLIFFLYLGSERGHYHRVPVISGYVSMVLLKTLDLTAGFPIGSNPLC